MKLKNGYNVKPKNNGIYIIILLLILLLILIVVWVFYNYPCELGRYSCNPTGKPVVMLMSPI